MQEPKQKEWKTGYFEGPSSNPDVNNSFSPAGSVEKSFSDESLALAKEVSKKLWYEKKISYNWDHVKDSEFLAFVIEHKHLP